MDSSHNNSPTVTAVNVPADGSGPDVAKNRGVDHCPLDPTPLYGLAPDIQSLMTITGLHLAVDLVADRVTRLASCSRDNLTLAQQKRLARAQGALRMAQTFLLKLSTDISRTDAQACGKGSKE
jgi:hypothetical protein